MNANSWKALFPSRKKYCQIPDEILEKILELFPGAKSFLDVGCGDGSLVCYLRKLGYSAIGIDINTYAALAYLEFSQWHFIRQGDIRNTDIENFDVIFCNMSLSSIKNQDERRNLLKKLLSKTGTLILTQHVLLDGITSYNSNTKIIGIWQTELMDLLEDYNGKCHLLYEDLDQYNVLSVVYELKL